MAPSSQFGRRRWSGASGHRTGTLVPGARAHHPPAACGGDSGYPVTHARSRAPRLPRAPARARCVPHGVRRSHGAVVRSDRSVLRGRPCPGRLPGSRGARPGELPWVRRPRRSIPDRNCSHGNLGALAIPGDPGGPFAGGTWTFGAERAAVLAVFRTAGLTADALATFYIGQRQGRRQDRHHRRIDTDDPRSRRPPPRHEDRRAGPDCGGLASSGERRRQRGHHQRPAGCPDPGRDRRVRKDDEMIQDEIFGPVITVQRFGSEDEAVAWANGVKYGLAASVWTKRPRPGHADVPASWTSAPSGSTPTSRSSPRCRTGASSTRVRQGPVDLRLRGLHAYQARDELHRRLTAGVNRNVMRCGSSIADPVVSYGFAQSDWLMS